MSRQERRGVLINIIRAILVTFSHKKRAQTDTRIHHEHGLMMKILRSRPRDLNSVRGAVDHVQEDRSEETIK